MFIRLFCCDQNDQSNFLMKTGFVKYRLCIKLVVFCLNIFLNYAKRLNVPHVLVLRHIAGFHPNSIFDWQETKRHKRNAILWMVIVTRTFYISTYLHFYDMDDRVLLRSSEKIEYFPSKMKNNRICMNYSTFLFYCLCLWYPHIWKLYQ